MPKKVSPQDAKLIDMDTLITLQGFKPSHFECSFKSIGNVFHVTFKDKVKNRISDDLQKIISAKGFTWSTGSI